MRPLIVRLPNWVGDVVMSLPTLWHLHHHGYALQLVGKRWAVPLLAGCGWPVHTLPATLRTVANIWRNEQQNQNALAIAEAGSKLYDKFVGFVESMDGINKALGQAQSQFQTAYVFIFQ